MSFSIADYAGFTGVAILLIAFLLQLAGRLGKDSFPYLLMNVVGAGIACAASCLIHYLPFIILEGTWTLVSVLALVQRLLRKG